MLALAEARGSALPVAGGAAAGLTGLGLIGLGLWAHRDVKRALERERIVSTPDARPPNALVTSAAAARSMAEVIRRNTVGATGGRTYAEVEPYLTGEGRPTSYAEAAGRNELTGQLLENPDHDLWIQSTTLQTGLMQAYMAFRMAELTMAMGAGLVGIGLGLVSAGRSIR
jgi:hypothetical protein